MKNTFYKFVGIVGALAGAGVVFAQDQTIEVPTSIVELPTGSVAAIVSYIPTLLTNVYPLVILAIGLPLAFWGVGKLIALVKAGFRTRTPRS